MIDFWLYVVTMLVVNLEVSYKSKIEWNSIDLAFSLREMMISNFLLLGCLEGC